MDHVEWFTCELKLCSYVDNIVFYWRKQHFSKELRYRLFVATIYEIRFYYLYFKYKCNNVCDPSLTECYNFVGTCVRLIVMHLVSVANGHIDGFYSVQTTIILPSACFVIGVHSYPIYISPRHDHIAVTLIHN